MTEITQFEMLPSGTFNGNALVGSKCNCDGNNENENALVKDVLGYRYKRVGYRHISCGISSATQQASHYVLSAVDTKVNRQVVVKIVPYSNAKYNENRSFSEEENYASCDFIEIARLKQIANFSGRGKIFCSLMEDYVYANMYVGIIFAQYGPDLYNLTHQSGQLPLVWDNVVAITYQIIQAVKFLHDNGLAHMDIKPENVVSICGDYKEVNVENAFFKNDEYHPQVFLEMKDPRIVIVDFGSSEFFTDKGTLVLRDNTDIFRAPELIMKLNCNYQCDIWSIGCTVMELYYGFSLFPATGDINHLAAVQKCIGSIPLWMIIEAEDRRTFENETLNLKETIAEQSKKLKDRDVLPLEEMIIFGPDKLEKSKFCQLMRSLLQVDPNKRSDVSDLLNLPYFESVPDHIQIDLED